MAHPLFQRLRRAAAQSILILSASQASAQDCGPDTPCVVEGGSYHLRLPEGAGPHPVLIWYHGHRGNGASIHRGGGLQSGFLQQGYALLAPNGFERSSGVLSFAAHDRSPRDDVAFTRAALVDAQSRASLDPDRVYVGGFSAGGSMAWLFACEAGADLAGMISVAGALRRPNATRCAGLEGLPVMQIHGFADGQVPFEGRVIRDWHQGNLWDALERARQANGCRSNPDAISLDAGFRTRLWKDSCKGAPVRLDIHDGGHGLPRGWTDRARRFLEQDLSQQ